MGRKPNYSFERKQREKAKADKREAKRQAKLAAKAAAQQPEADEAVPDEPGGAADKQDDGSTTEQPRRQDGEYNE